MSVEKADEVALHFARIAKFGQIDDLELLLEFVAEIAQGVAEALLLDENIVILNAGEEGGDPYFDRRDLEVKASVADVRDTVIPDEYGAAWEILHRMHR